MRTAYRVLSTVVAVGAIFPMGMAPAHADTSPVKVETSAWFWSAQTFGSGPGGVPYPAVPLSASGIKEGQLPVVYKGEKEKKADGTEIAKPDKESYLAWDIYFVPEGSIVDSFTFTLFLDPDAEQLFAPEVAVPGQPARAGQPAIVACIPKIGFGDGQGEAFAVKPEDDCTDQIYGSFDEAQQSYTFDATVYAQDWVDGKDNYGLGIRPPEEAQDPFQLIFKGAADVQATISYTPAEDDTDTGTVIDDGAVTPVLPPVTNTGGSGYVPSAPIAQPQPQPAPQPAPVVVTAAPRVLTNVASSPLTTSRGLSPVFWFAMIGGVLLLGTASLILGDPLEAAAASRSQRIRTNGRHRLNVPAGVPVRAGAVRPRTV